MMSTERVSFAVWSTRYGTCVSFVVIMTSCGPGLRMQLNPGNSFSEVNRPACWKSPWHTKAFALVKGVCWNSLPSGL